MSPLPLRWRPWRRRSADPLRSPLRAWRTAPGEAGEDAPAPPPPPPASGEPEPAAGPEAERPSRTASLFRRLLALVPPERRSLYASGALVVLIVLVIIILASRPTRRVLPLLPRGLASVSVLDVGRFLHGPVHQALLAADHPAAGRFEELEETLDLSLRHDVSRLVTTDQGRVLFGRFRPARLRSAWEEDIQRRLGDRAPQFLTRHVEGQAYTFSPQVDERGAVATVGSSIAVVGRRHLVRRFLKVRAGLFPSLAEAPAFADAHEGSLAGGAVLTCVEAAGGGPLLQTLRPLLQAPAAFGAEAPAEPAADPAQDLRSAFFALLPRGNSLRLVIRLVAASEEAAEQFAQRLEAEAAAAQLAKLLGVEDAPQAQRSGAALTLEASVPLEAFAAQVEENKANPTEAPSLVIKLLAR